MRQRTGCRQPILCILPPRVLWQIVRNETERQRTALGTLPASTVFRILPGNRSKAPVAEAVAQVTVTGIRQLRGKILASCNAQGSLGLTKYQACIEGLGGTTV